MRIFLWTGLALVLAAPLRAQHCPPEGSQADERQVLRAALVSPLVFVGVVIAEPSQAGRGEPSRIVRLRALEVLKGPPADTIRLRVGRGDTLAFESGDAYLVYAIRSGDASVGWALGPCSRSGRARARVRWTNGRRIESSCIRSSGAESRCSIQRMLPPRGAWLVGSPLVMSPRPSRGQRPPTASRRVPARRRGAVTQSRSRGSGQASRMCDSIAIDASSSAPGTV